MRFTTLSLFLCLHYFVQSWGSRCLSLSLDLYCTMYTKIRDPNSTVHPLPLSPAYKCQPSQIIVWWHSSWAGCTKSIHSSITFPEILGLMHFFNEQESSGISITVFRKRSSPALVNQPIRLSGTGHNLLIAKSKVSIWIFNIFGLI